MAVSNNAVAGVVLNYLECNPGEIETLGPLVLASLAGPSPVAGRGTMQGQVTCAVVAVTPDWRVLHLRHRSRSGWLLPGGRVEPSDRSLLGAALRVLDEATGIAANTVIPDTARPLDIGAHVVPANPARGEPSHVYYDIRFAVHVPDDSVWLRSADVDHSWISVDEIAGTLGEKIRARHIQEFAGRGVLG